jgi:hypothetical protein
MEEKNILNESHKRALIDLKKDIGVNKNIYLGLNKLLNNKMLLLKISILSVLNSSKEEGSSPHIYRPEKSNF